MGSWVDDFSTFQSPNVSSVSIPKSSKFIMKPPSRSEKIKAELKLLEWHKLANHSAIKAALMQTKTLKGDGTEEDFESSEKTAQWMRKVIDDEHNKPLEVSKDFIIDFEKRESKSSEKLTSQVERHIETLKMLRGKLEGQSELQSRQEEFREWKKEFKAKKNAVLAGKTLAEISKFPDASTNHYGNPKSKSVSSTSSPGKIQNQGSGSVASKELKTVLESLSKLAELENRITSLEKDNAYDQLRSAEQTPAIMRTTLEFKKKRTAGTHDDSVRSVYALRQKREPLLPVKNTNSNYKSGGMSRAAGGGVAAVLAKRTQPQARGRGTGGGPGTGFFLTANQENDDNDEREDDPREIARKERARQLALASDGQKNLRARIQKKKTRTKELTSGNRRHEEALKELNQRRAANLIRAKPVPVPVRAVKGASAGHHHKNKHLQELEDIKKSHNRRKDELSGKVKARPTRVSMTAPANLTHKQPPMDGGHGRAGGTDGTRKRVPATQTGGTVTRRTTSVPVRREAAERDFNTMPAIVGSGVSGVRNLKGQKNNKRF